MAACIACDFDGTLAHYYGWVDELHLGDPIMPMVERVKRALASGMTVKIFTARLAAKGADVDAIRAVIELWCEKYIGRRLEVTCIKSPDMVEFWDDRAVGIVENTGMKK